MPLTPSPHPFTSVAALTHLIRPLFSSKGPGLGRGCSSRGCSSLMSFLRALGWPWRRCGSELLSGAQRGVGEGVWGLEGARDGLDVVGNELVRRG